MKRRMWRFFAVISATVFTLLSLIACDIRGFFPNMYRLRLEGEVEGLKLERYYEGGETVTFSCGVICDASVSIYLNGELLEGEEVRAQSGNYYQYTFTMPNFDSVLEVVVTDGMHMLPQDSAVFTVGYDYGLHVEGKAVLLLNGNTVFFDQEAYGVAPLLAGDLIAVKYTGELLVQETYPGTVVFEGGEVISVQKHSATIVELEYTKAGWYINNGSRRSVQVESPEYVVHADGSFSPVTELADGTILYATEKDRWTEEGQLCFSLHALYTEYPLPIVEAKTLFPWIETLDNVQKVKTVSHSSCKPSSVTTIITSVYAEDRGQVCDYLQNLTLKEVPASEWQVDGGSVVALVLQTETDTYTLTIAAGYVVINGVGYKPEQKLPEFVYGTTVYGLEDDSVAALYIQGEKVAEYEELLSQLEFIESDKPVGGAFGYALKGDWARIVLYGDKHFSLLGVFYEVVGETDFSKIFEQFPIT